MSHMRVVRMDRKREAALVEEALDPKPLAANELMGQTVVSLISPGTEIHNNYLGDQFPARPGYVAVFDVQAVGDAIADIKIGDRVYCSGPNGIGGHRSVQRCDRPAAIPVPQGLDPAVAVHARLMAVSMSSITRMQARFGDTVLVTGLGPVGHLACQNLRAVGYRVTGVDRDEARRAILQAKGFEHVHAAVPEGQTYHAALECTGHEQATLDAAKALRKDGELFLIGVPWAKRTDLDMNAFLHTIFRRNLTIHGGSEWRIARHATDGRVGSTFGNMATALTWLADGRVDVTGLYGTIAPAQAPRVYAALAEQKTDTLTTLFDWR